MITQDARLECLRLAVLLLNDGAPKRIVEAAEQFHGFMTDKTDDAEIIRVVREFAEKVRG